VGARLLQYAATRTIRQDRSGLPRRHPDGRGRRLQAGPRPGSPYGALILKPRRPPMGRAVARDDGKVCGSSTTRCRARCGSGARGRQGGVAVAAAHARDSKPHRIGWSLRALTSAPARLPASSTPLTASARAEAPGGRGSVGREPACVCLPHRGARHGRPWRYRSR